MDIFFMLNSNITANSTASILDLQTVGWIFCLLVSLPENLYVIWLIVTGAGNGVASEFFSLNMSVCEIFISFQALGSLLGRFSLDIWFISMFLSGFSISGRPVFQSLICVERYLAVVYPVMFLKYKPLRYRLICCTAAWIIILMSCVFASLTLFQCHMFWFMCFYLCQALLTFSVMLFCCLAVLRALKQSGPGDRKKEEENHMKRRAFKNIIMIIMSMLFIYASYVLTGLSYVLTHEIMANLWSVGQFCFLLGGLVQPLLYFHKTGKLRFCKTP